MQRLEKKNGKTKLFDENKKISFGDLLVFFNNLKKVL